ncbi:MAG: 50S ribosomal protein L25 [Acidimicrobiia bacterium]|nr:50S ribosomal protein L25 [Acidimicrobiia bacterium]
MSSVSLNVETRQETGSAASRRLRSEGKVPAIVYGHGSDPLTITVDHRELDLAFHTEAGRNVIFELDLGGKKTETAIAQAIDRHPFKPFIRHIDFMLVNLDEELTADVPVTMVGEAPGARDGGLMEVIRPTVRVTAILSSLPSEIVIDVSELGQGDTLRIGDLPEMEGVVYAEDEGLTVVTISAVSEVELPEVEVEVELDEDGLPILIGDDEAEGEGEDSEETDE